MLSTVDTLELSKEFVDVGFTQEQAEKMAITYKNMQEGLATKEDIYNLKKDIDNLEKNLQQNINHVKELLDSKIDSKINPLYWGMGLLVVITGGTFATMITLLINVLNQ